MQLLWFLQTHCSSFSLVWRDPGTAQDVARALQPFILRECHQDEWPGTKLLGHTALVRHYASTPDSIAVLRRVTGLYE